jgi:hypothetical protein
MIVGISYSELASSLVWCDARLDGEPGVMTDSASVLARAVEDVALGRVAA